MSRNNTGLSDCEKPRTSASSRRMISVDAACDRLGESRSAFYRDTLHLLRSYTLGRARKIDADSVDELIEKRLAANSHNPSKPRRGRSRKPPIVQAEAAA